MDACACKKHYPGASQQHIANYFSHSQENPSISQCCVKKRYFQRGKKKKEKERTKQVNESIKSLTGANPKKTLRMC
jgi:hypothetical protein